MKNYDLENIYSKIDNKITLVGSFIGDRIIPQIIKACRLKPYSIFTPKYKQKIKLEKHWVDEFGNSLKLENKIPKIILNDTGIIGATTISTDLFSANSINETICNGKSIFIANGKFCDRDVFLVAVYGQDEYLRAFFYYNGWQRISPLLLGMNTLHEIFNNINKQFLPIDNQLYFIIKFDIEKCVLANLKRKNDIKSFFNNKIINNILQKE
jgi:hypothetical protein